MGATAFRTSHTPEQPTLPPDGVALTHPDGAVFPYAHDTLGRLSAVYQGASLTVPLLWFVYNAQGLPQSRMEGTGSSLAYSYDAVGRLAGIANSFNWSPPNGALTFARNPAGQIISRSQSNDGYAWAGAYSVNRDYTTNGRNQYTTSGPPSGPPASTFSYDANGNLTSDGSANFTYDVENRLVAAGGSRTAALRYDPLGRLYEVVGAATTRFLYDGDALIGEYNLAGTMTDRYVHGSNAGADDPLVWYGQGTVYWLQADHQGSITAIANIDGNFSFANAYDEYGIPRAGNVGRFQYTGQAWLGDLGMYYYKARIYSPTLGRFLQTDPVGYEDQTNLYAYVGNDPVNRVDPTGLCSTGSRVAGENAIQCRPSEGVEWAGKRSSTRPSAGSRAQGRRAQNRQTLTAVTVRGGPGQRPPWVIKWELAHPSARGGMVVQDIQRFGDVRTRFQEAWPIPAGQRTTDDARLGDGEDDQFSHLSPNSSVIGSARFYDGVTEQDLLGMGYKYSHPETFAGNILSRPGPPHLPLDNATPPVVRTWPQ